LYDELVLEVSEPPQRAVRELFFVLSPYDSPLEAIEYMVAVCLAIALIVAIFKIPFPWKNAAYPYL
jgi:hypothetical protein